MNDKNHDCDITVVSIPVHKQKPYYIQQKLLNFQINKLAKDSDSFRFINLHRSRHNPYDGTDLSEQTTRLQIFSDPSLTGWGGSFNGTTTDRHWAQEELAHLTDPN